ncbi:hypothetical protein Tco_0064908 [Tanacetum coccineum]
MASLDYHLNPLFSIKECSSCGALYTRNCGCSKGSLEDKILVPVPDSSQRPPHNCTTCGDPVDGLYCQPCAFVRKCLNEGWYTIHDENEILNTSESSNDNTNIVSAPQEPFVFNQDPGQNSSQNFPQINHNCIYECGDSLDDIFCQRCTCKSCGKGAHYGYNCPPQIPIISNLEPCYNQNLNEILQNLQSLQQQSFLGTCQQCGCNEYDGVCFYCTVGNRTQINFSTPYPSNDSPNFANHPPQPQYETNICELCGNDAHFGYDCSPQVPSNRGGPYATFQCQPMNQDFYNSNLSGFDQFQPPQFPVNYPPQETSKEILQAQDDLMEAIQAFLKEYDHIPPNKKCMALLLAEERFLKIKQAMEEEQNQPGVMQELLLKLMDDLQILKGSQQEKKETAAQSFIPYWNFSMIDDEEARENFMKDICTFLRKFSRIPFGVTPKQYRQEDIQELMSKLLEDVRNISEELSEYINCPSWNRPIFYDNDDVEYTIIYSKPKAITPDLPTVEPDNSLSMGDEHLDTIPSVENLVPIPSEFEGISEDTCDVPVCEDPSTFDALNDHSEILSDSNNDDTSSDDDDFEDIEYVSLEEKLLNINRLIANIKSLNDNPSPDRVFKSPSSVPIPVTDSDSFFEESDTSLSHLDNSLPEFEPFSDDTEETRSGKEVETFLVPEDSIPPGIESNFDPGGGEIVVSQNVEDDDSFTFVIQTFLPFLTYPADSPLLLSTGSEDTIFDPDIST